MYTAAALPVCVQVLFPTWVVSHVRVLVLASRILFHIIGVIVLITPAFAQTAAAGGPESGLLSFLPLLFMFAIMYFLMIRPQIKKQKEHKNLLDNLQKGDEVIAAGGMLGRISKMTDSYVTLEIATQGDKPVEVQVQRAAVAVVLPKGTIKSI